MALPNGPRVRELRDGLRWSQEQLARKTGRTRQAISKVENGKPVSETLMLQLAKAFRVDLAVITLPDEAQQEQAADEPDEAQQEQVPDEPDEVAA